MSKTAVYFSALTGKIVWLVPFAPGATHRNGNGNRYLVLDCPADVDVTHYVCLQTLQLVAYPARPSARHMFDYDTKGWVLDEEMEWQVVRFKRDKLLAESDWRVTKAMETGEDLSEVWADYRQELRDITLHGDPTAIVWPVAPT